MDGHEIDFNYLKENKKLWTFDSFRYMMNNSYYPFAKFIFENIETDLRYDIFFAETCRNNKVEEAKLLSELCNRYKLNIENEKISSFDIDYKIDYLETDSCPICFETNYGIKTSCNHFFCKKCFPNILFITSKCPICRSKLQVPKRTY